MNIKDALAVLSFYVAVALVGADVTTLTTVLTVVVDVVVAAAVVDVVPPALQ